MPVRRVAILTPMPSELRPLRAPLGLRPGPAGDPDLLHGSLDDVEVVAALTGIGMRAGARCAEHVLEATAPDHLVVVGIAGGLGASVAVGDVVTPETVVDLATGATFRPERLGDAVPRGTLASSDVLLEDPREAAELADRGVVAVDMETAAIGAVCEERQVPWSVFRAVSDRADDGSTDSEIFRLVGPDGRPRVGAVARFLLIRPHRIPQIVRLAFGSREATRAAAAAAVSALVSARGSFPIARGGDGRPNARPRRTGEKA